MAFTYFLYRSSGRLDSFVQDCKDILVTARRRNDQLQLTGFLHAEDGIFVQWLEGPAAAMGQIVALIRQDPRHHDLTVFGEGPLPARQFPGWSMGFSSDNSALLFDFLVEQGANSHDLRAYGDCLHRFLLQRAA